MKNNLWTFGCSFTEIFIDRLKKLPSNLFDYYKKNYSESELVSWQEIVSSKLDMNLKNYGWGGGSNYQIFQSICDNSNKFTKNDVIIIEWTDITRSRITTKESQENNSWVSILSGAEINKNDYYKIDIIKNRIYDNYKDEVLSFMTMINRLCDEIGCKVYYWTIDMYFLEYLKQNKKLDKRWLFYNKFLIKNLDTNYIGYISGSGGKSINEETQIDDNHFGVSGNKVLGKLIIDYINEDFSYRR